MKSRLTKFLFPSLLAAFAVTAACGGGSGGASTAPAAFKPADGQGAAGPRATLAPEEALLAQVKQHPLVKLGPWLINLHEEYQQFANSAGANGRSGRSSRDFVSRNPLLRVSQGYVAVEGVANDPGALRGTLVAIGARDIRGNRLFSARVPVDGLARLGRDPALRSAAPVLARTRSLPVPARSQGVESLFGLDGPDDPGIDGTGLRIGALSDSFGCEPPAFLPGAPTSTVAEDIANGELPSDLVVLEDACPGNTDEGRAMMQLIHDVAPGASQAFHTAFNSRFDFACGILELGGIDTTGAAAACDGFGAVGGYAPATGSDISDVIVDDVIYFVEPMFMPGAVAEAANTVYGSGIPYFSSAGNNERFSYEAAYSEVVDDGNFGNNLNRGAAPGPNPIRVHDFSGTGDTTQTLGMIQSGGASFVALSFQWDQPHFSSALFNGLLHGADLSAGVPAASTDMDLLFYNDKGILVPLCPPGVATGITCQITGTNNIVSGDAADLVALFVTGPETASQFQIRIVRSGGPAPNLVKYVPFQLAGTTTIDEYDTRSGTSFGHSNAAGAASIGAAAWYATVEWKDNPADPFGLYRNPDDTPRCDPACAEDFSSAGNIPIFFDALGQPLGAPFVRENPWVTGPDGGNTTFFISDSSLDDDDSDGFNSPFSGFLTPPDDDPASEYPNFFGTSASAPHVAAVAGLMLQKNSGLTPDDVYGILRDTAEDMSKRFTNVATASGPAAIVFEVEDPDPAGFDYDTGWGFVDAEAALGAVAAP